MQRRPSELKSGDTVLRLYAKRMGKAGIANGKSGAIAVIQRCFTASGICRRRTRQHVIEVARVRIVRHLMRRGVISAEGHVEPSEELTEREPAVSQLAYASVSGLMPAGPELRRKLTPLKLTERAGVIISAPLSVHDRGFSLHAATRAGAPTSQDRKR